MSYLLTCYGKHGGEKTEGDLEDDPQGRLTAANLKEHERLLDDPAPAVDGTTASTKTPISPQPGLNGILKGGKLWRASEKLQQSSGSSPQSSDGRTEGDGGTGHPSVASQIAKFNSGFPGSKLQAAPASAKRGVRFSDSTAPAKPHETSQQKSEVSFLVGGYVADQELLDPRIQRVLRPPSSQGSRASSISSDTDGESMSSQDTVIAVSPAAALKFQMAQEQRNTASTASTRKVEESKEAKVLVLRAGDHGQDEGDPMNNPLLRKTFESNTLMRRVNSAPHAPHHQQQWGGKIMASDDGVLLNHHNQVNVAANRRNFVVPTSGPTFHHPDGISISPNAGIILGPEKYRTIPFDRPDKDWQWSMQGQYQHAVNCPVTVAKTSPTATLGGVDGIPPIPGPPKGSGKEDGGIFSKLVKSIRGGKKDPNDGSGAGSPREAVAVKNLGEGLEGRIEPSLQTANVAEARRKFLNTLSTTVGDRNSTASNGTDSYSLEDIDAALVDDRDPTVAVIGARLAGGKHPVELMGSGGDGSTATTDSGYGSSLGEGDTNDELAQFVAADQERIDRLRKKYATEPEEDDDGGFNRRPSVRGIKPRFGSTTEILQQMQIEMSPPGGYAGNHMTWPYGTRGTSPAPDSYGQAPVMMATPVATVARGGPQPGIIGKRAIRVPLPAVQEEQMVDDQMGFRVLAAQSPLPVAADSAYHQAHPTSRGQGPVMRPALHPPPPNLRPLNEDVRWLPQQTPPRLPLHPASTLPRGSYYGSHQQLSSTTQVSQSSHPQLQSHPIHRPPPPNIRPTPRQTVVVPRLPNSIPPNMRAPPPNQRSSWAGDPTISSYQSPPQHIPGPGQRFPRPAPPPRINSQVTTVTPNMSSQNGPHIRPHVPEPPQYIPPPFPPSSSQEVSPLKIGVQDERGAPEGASNSPPSSNDERIPVRN
ncbi:unnamed protein product [Cyprideis torosa]|uniref:Uncharacterized protein n=1 Tax=Cyprideis torosa TaxID=163714 RepID=A0A7R8ZIE4_9CRUS|nr:unnamed protein product [Cyprideis torosa]CAG0884616.1 unnamed protein product [Cyprideis torosa]